MPSEHPETRLQPSGYPLRGLVSLPVGLFVVVVIGARLLWPVLLENLGGLEAGVALPLVFVGLFALSRYYRTRNGLPPAAAATGAGWLFTIGLVALGWGFGALVSPESGIAAQGIWAGLAVLVAGRHFPPHRLVGAHLPEPGAALCTRGRGEPIHHMEPGLAGARVRHRRPQHLRAPPLHAERNHPPRRRRRQRGTYNLLAKRFAPEMPLPLSFSAALVVGLLMSLMNHLVGRRLGARKGNLTFHDWSHLVLVFAATAAIMLSLSQLVLTQRLSEPRTGRHLIMLALFMLSLGLTTFPRTHAHRFRPGS